MCLIYIKALFRLKWKSTFDVRVALQKAVNKTVNDFYCLQINKLKTISPQSMNNQSRISPFWDNINKERLGVPLVEFVENLKKLGMSKTKAAEIFKIPRSTLMKRPSESVMLVKTHVLAAIRLEKLINQAQDIVLNSLHPSAKDFDAGRWLGEWIEIQQPALAGLKPSELLLRYSRWRGKSSSITGLY